MYRIHAESFVRSIRHLTGISKYRYSLYLYPNKYILQIQDEVEIIVEEFQFETTQSIKLEIDPSIIDLFKSSPLKQLEGDIHFQIENNNCSIFYPESNLITTCSVIALEAPIEELTSVVSTFNYSLLSSFLKLYKGQSELFIYKGYLLSFNQDKSILFWKQGIPEDLSFSIKDSKLWHNTLSKVKAEGDLVSIIEEEFRYVLEISANLKLNYKETVKVVYKYTLSALDYRCDDYIQLIQDIEDKGRLIEITEAKLERTKKVIESKGYKPEDLLTFTEDTKIPVKDLLSLFSDLNSESVKVYRDELNVRYKDDRPNLVLTLYFKVGTYYSSDVVDEIEVKLENLPEKT